MRQLCAWTVAAALTLGAGTTAQTVPPERAVEQVIDAWATAFAALDGDRSAALYAEDAVLWGTIAPELAVGRAAIREYFHSGRQRARERRVVIGDHRTRVFGDTAVSSGAYAFHQTLLDGTPSVRRARFSLVFVRRNDVWLIVDHHSSDRPVPASAPAPAR